MDDLVTPTPGPAISTGALLGRRAFARAFDLFAVSVFVVPVLALTLRDDGGDDVRFPPLVIALYALVPALVEARLLVRDARSPGKRLSGLAVLAGDGLEPTWPRALARVALTWSVPALVVLLAGWVPILVALVVLYAPALLTGGRADLADLVAGTRVVFRGDVRDD